MSYAKPNQAPFTDAAKGQFVVRLDTGAFVAVSARVEVNQTTGDPAVIATAVHVDATGKPILDGAGAVTTSGFSHGSNATEVGSVGGMGALQRLVVMAVLGENTGQLWSGTLHRQALQHANIRTNIAAAASAGPVTTLSTLL